MSAPCQAELSVLRALWGARPSPTTFQSPLGPLGERPSPTSPQLPGLLWVSELPAAPHQGPVSTGPVGELPWLPPHRSPLGPLGERPSPSSTQLACVCVSPRLGAPGSALWCLRWVPWVSAPRPAVPRVLWGLCVWCPSLPGAGSALGPVGERPWPNSARWPEGGGELWGCAVSEDPSPSAA